MGEMDGELDGELDGERAMEWYYIFFMVKHCVIAAAIRCTIQIPRPALSAISNAKKHEI
jgi:hypothetical protein